MTENIDTALTNEQKELDVRKLEMEALRQQFIKASAVFIAQWYNVTAKHYVCTDSQNTLRLSRAELSSMKIKLKDLTDDAERIANEFLSDHSLWWHLDPKGEDGYASPYMQYGNKCPDIIDKPIRTALGKLGVIFEEYGYDVTVKGGGSDDGVSVWNNKNVSPYPINPLPYYPDSFDWSKDMRDIMRRYNEIYKQAYDAYLEIKRLQQSKLDKQATDLWDSA
jgi:predicted DNA binding CopG/RHH family protein